MGYSGARRAGKHRLLTWSILAVAEPSPGIGGLERPCATVPASTVICGFWSHGRSEMVRWEMRGRGKNGKATDFSPPRPAFLPLLSLPRIISALQKARNVQAGEKVQSWKETCGRQRDGRGSGPMRAGQAQNPWRTLRVGTGVRKAGAALHHCRCQQRFGAGRMANLVPRPCRSSSRILKAASPAAGFLDQPTEHENPYGLSTSRYEVPSVCTGQWTRSSYPGQISPCGGRPVSRSPTRME